jgi:proline dehydrogenase
MSLFDRALVRTLPVVPKGVVSKVARRYVAGETLDDAVATVAQLNSLGAMATLDLLGESVHDLAEARRTADEYVTMLDRIEAEGLDSNVSVKPTGLGLSIDEATAEQSIRRIAQAAAAHGNFVRIDMEDASTTDATLGIYKTLQAETGNLGCVLQAYMRRTLTDIAELPSESPNVRICKGIYIEPREIAWKGYETVRRAFVAALEKLLSSGVYTAVATHDEYLVAEAVRLIDRYEIPRDRVEFQMLLGVDEQMRDILLAQGHRLRVYVPYGRDWYAYSMRRLRENPAVAGHVARAVLKGG